MSRLAIALLCWCAAASRLSAQPLLPPDTARIIGAVIPLGGLVDEDDRPFNPGNDPVPPVWILSPIYSRCPYTCSPITHALQAALARTDLTRGEYRVISLSFDPAETANGLRTFRTNLQLPPEWLTLRARDPAALQRTLDGLDFRTIALDNGQFAHPDLIVILSSDFRVSEFLFGVDFEPAQLSAAVHSARTGGSRLAAWRPLLFPIAAAGTLASAFVLALRVMRRR